jgi:hypothetical protein
MLVAEARRRWDDGRASVLVFDCMLHVAICVIFSRRVVRE